jgi:hypothetical protein
MTSSGKVAVVGGGIMGSGIAQIVRPFLGASSGPVLGECRGLGRAAADLD